MKNKYKVTRGGEIINEEVTLINCNVDDLTEEELFKVMFSNKTTIRREQ